MELFNVQFTCVSPCIRGPSRLSTILLISRTQFRCMDSALYGQDFVTESFCCSRASLNEALADTKLSSLVIFKGGQVPKYQRRPSVGNIEVSTIFQYGRSLLEVTFFLFRLLVASHFLNGKVKKTESFRLKKTNAAEKIFASQTIKLCFNINEVPDNQLSAFLIRHLSFL